MSALVMDPVLDGFLVRLGPPSKGDTIHHSSCHYAQKPNALRWRYADEHAWHHSETPWLHVCGACGGRVEAWARARALKETPA